MQENGSAAAGLLAGPVGPVDLSTQADRTGGPVAAPGGPGAVFRAAHSAFLMGGSQTLRPLH